LTPTLLPGLKAMSTVNLLPLETADKGVSEKRHINGAESIYWPILGTLTKIWYQKKETKQKVEESRTDTKS
jgi:hypothetical protein